MTHQFSSSCTAYLKLPPSPDQVENSSEAKFLLSLTEEVVIGREATCQIVVDSKRYPTVSRHHAKIQPYMDGSKKLWRICDLNAANGTYLNGNRVQGCQSLQPGDCIILSKDGPEFFFESETTSHPIVSETLPLVISDPPATTDTNITSQLSSSTPFPPPLISPATQPIQHVVTSTTKDGLSRSLWNLMSEDDITVLSGHGDLVRAVAFSLDGKYLASGSADRTVKIWDLISKEETQTLAGHKLAVSAVAFNSDGTLLASGSADKSIKIWNLTSGEATQQLTKHGMGVNAVAFSPDGNHLASGSADKTIKIWNLASGETFQTLAAQKMGVNAVVFSPNSQLLASGSADRVVKLWKMESGEEISTLPALRSSINALFFSPDGEILAISTDDRTIRFWSLKLEQEIRVFSGYNWQTGGLAISQNGQMLASGSEDKTVKVWRP